MSKDKGSSTGSSTRVASFEIHHTRFLDHNGEVTGELPEFTRDSANLISLYRAMVRTRIFDKKAVALQRTGQLGTFASSLGQEASFVGIGSAMRTEDVLLPTYRESGAMFIRGVTMTELLLYWGGDERGMDYAGPREDFPICVPIATHLPHAVGVAYAMKLRRQPRVAVCTLGDGATSKGDFYEALNMAGAWQLPVVFVVCNNEWAISVPRRAQTHAQTLAQKAIAGEIEGEQVDGNDVIAVRHCVSRAIEKARSGDGPSLIEALSYRMSDHTTADDASRYRAKEELEKQAINDPITRLNTYLIGNNLLTEKDREALEAECAAEVEAAAKEYLATPPPPSKAMFDYLYETLPASLVAQREFATKRGSGNA
ncbi:MAG: pyruvate dehydrogenase (acetyl-transferring) E1 component subunit alpha [Gammaproteobacteria bacterium]|nr:pyruvate dehydrogenase (acetyl-transferring) E1 component subunit alpha [Gammaproteobacteria bacterium]